MSTPSNKAPIISTDVKEKRLYTIEINIGGQRLSASIEGDERQNVARELAKLADSLVHGRTLIWRWEDGAEWDLSEKTIKEAPEDG